MQKVVPTGVLASQNANVQKPPEGSNVAPQRHNLPEMQRPGMGSKIIPGGSQQFGQAKPASGPNIRPGGEEKLGSSEIQKLRTSMGSEVQKSVPRTEMQKAGQLEMQYLVAGGAKIRQRIASKFQKPYKGTLEKSGTPEMQQTEKSGPPGMPEPLTLQKPGLLGMQMLAGVPKVGLATLQKLTTTLEMQQIQKLRPQRMQEPELPQMQISDGGPMVLPTQLQKSEPRGMQKPAGGPKIAPAQLQNVRPLGFQKTGLQNVRPPGLQNVGPPGSGLPGLESPGPGISSTESKKSGIAGKQKLFPGPGSPQSGISMTPTSSGSMPNPEKAPTMGLLPASQLASLHPPLATHNPLPGPTQLQPPVSTPSVPTTSLSGGHSRPPSSVRPLAVSPSGPPALHASTLFRPLFSDTSLFPPGARSTSLQPPAPTSIASQPRAPVFSRPSASMPLRSPILTPSTASPSVPHALRSLSPPDSEVSPLHASGPVPRTSISIGLPSHTQAPDSMPAGPSHPPAFPQSPVSALHASTSSCPPLSTPLHPPKTEVTSLGSGSMPFMMGDPHPPPLTPSHPRANLSRPLVIAPSPAVPRMPVLSVPFKPPTTISHSPILVSTSPTSISVPLVSGPKPQQALTSADLFSLDETPSQEDDPFLMALNLIRHVFDIIADNWQVQEQG